MIKIYDFSVVTNKSDIIHFIKLLQTSYNYNSFKTEARSKLISTPNIIL